MTYEPGTILKIKDIANTDAVVRMYPRVVVVSGRNMFMHVITIILEPYPYHLMPDYKNRYTAFETFGTEFSFRSSTLDIYYEEYK